MISEFPLLHFGTIASDCASLRLLPANGRPSICRIHRFLIIESSYKNPFGSQSRRSFTRTRSLQSSILRATVPRPKEDMHYATTFWRVGEAADGRLKIFARSSLQALAIRWCHGTLHSTLETNGIPRNSLKINK